MSFNKDIPTAGTSLRASNPQILENQESIQDAVNNEHIFSGTDAGTQTGDHTQGSARCFFAATAPAVRIDTTGFIETDNGSLWVNSGDNALSIMTDYSQAVAADKWTLVSDEVIAVLLAANRVFAGTLGVDGNFEVGTGSEFTVVAASGNVATAGALDVAGDAEVTGVATIGDGSLLKTAAAPTTDAMITNKKYVDDKSINGSQSIVFNAAAPTAFADLDLSSVVGSQETQVVLSILNAGSSTDYEFRPNGSSNNAYRASIGGSDVKQVTLSTDSSGIIEWKATSNNATTIRVNSFTKLVN